MLSDLINFFKLLFLKKIIVIYCESNSYSKYFTEILNQLLKKKVEFIYICQKGDLNISEFNLKNFFQFNNIEFISAIISSISCDKLILTTPDFGDTLKISKNCKEYIYLFHSLVSSHMGYREKAFDHYDTICCTGPHHFNEFSEKKIAKKQKLLKIGYPFLDTLINRNKSEEVNEKSLNLKKVLIAPTWLPNERNYYYENYFDIIKILINKNYQVTLRPHPEFLKRFDNKIQEIIEKIKSEKSFNIDDSNNNFISMQQSKYLITDWSGISLEFAFTFKRPVLFLNTKKKILNDNFHKISFNPIEISVREKIGLIINEDEKKNIEFFFKNLDENKDEFEAKIENCIKELTYNYGSASLEFVKHFKEYYS